MKVIHLLRKPLSEKTVAANTLKHGTGGLNIDGSRVGAEKRTYKGSGVSEMRYTDGRAGLTDGRGRDREFSVSGRWPANLILQHLPECRCDGTKKVRGIAGGDHSGTTETHVTVGGFGHDRHNITRHNDENGKETVANWICAEGCPVKALDEQSGVSKSAPVGVTFTNTPARSWKNTSTEGIRRVEHGDGGGASRFFKQVGGDEEP